MYKIRYTPHFKRTYRKLTKKDSKLKEITKVVIRKLVENPFNPSLETHKASNPIFGKAWSSRVTGDIRMIWDFTDHEVILLLAFGGHSGKHKIYK